MTALSIIIPYYNAQKYTDELLSVLNPQITEDIEVILIDDGSKIPFKSKYKWLQVIRQENGGASAARNTGLDNATGDYIAFIDADDLVSEDYIAQIIKKIKAESFDYCYLSWKTLPGGWQCNVRLKTIEDKFPSFNLCVWNRIYKRSMIGDIRFNTNKLIAEDAEFIRKVKEDGKKKAFISKHLYFYRSTTPDSLTKKFAKGELNTRRIVYNIPHVKATDLHLIDEFREADKEGEVILLTDKNEIKELENYAMIMPSNTTIKGTELRGQRTLNFSKINIPNDFQDTSKDFQIIIYTKHTFEIGGIETFIYNLSQSLCNLYDILVLYDAIDMLQLNRLLKYVKVERIKPTKKYKCDSLIINRITDAIPTNISYKQKIQMCHTCRMGQDWTIPKGADHVIFPSVVAKDSFKYKTGEVIKNPVVIKESREALKLVTASRLNTFEKGKNRIVQMAKILEVHDIPYIWIVFTKTDLGKCPKGLIRLEPELNISSYIKAADYLVQLSDEESFCYSIVEALSLGTKVITTPIKVLPEIGFVDKVTGYIVPYDLKADYEEIYENRHRQIEYTYDNQSVVDSWIKILGEPHPKNLYNPLALVNTKVTRDYQDMQLGIKLLKGTVLQMTRERAEEVLRAGYIKILD